MLTPTIPGWKCETVGDDIAWIKIGPDGRRMQSIPKAASSGWPGHSYQSNPNAMDTLKENIIFTNCALTDDGDIWWRDGRRAAPPPIDWKGGTGPPQARNRQPIPTPRSPPRPAMSGYLPGVGEARGRPDRHLYLRRPPYGCHALVHEATSWITAYFMGATASSETTAGQYRRSGQPTARPICHAALLRLQHGDYFQHWLTMGDRLGNNARASSM